MQYQEIIDIPLKKIKKKKKFKEQILDDAIAKCRNYCECGHTVIMAYTEVKTICNYCYRTVYNKNEKGQKQKFKDELKKAMINERKKEYEIKTNKSKN